MGSFGGCADASALSVLPPLYLMHKILHIIEVWFSVVALWIAFKAWAGGCFETGLEGKLLPWGKPNPGWDAPTEDEMEAMGYDRWIIELKF